MRTREILRDCLTETLAQSFFAALRLHPLAIGGRVVEPSGRVGWRAQVFFWAGPRPLGDTLDGLAREGAVAVERFAELGIDELCVGQLLEERAETLERATAAVHDERARGALDLADDEALFARMAATATAELRAFRAEQIAARP